MISRRVLSLAVVIALPVALFSATGSVAQEPKQSPIDITAAALRADAPMPPLRVSYGRSPVSLSYVSKDSDCAARHREETEEAGVEPGAGHVTLGGTRYELVQFHFHTPSEHRVQGFAAPMEMHLVHRSAAGRVLVIGVPLLAGGQSSVDTVLARLAPECGGEVPVGEIDLASLLPEDRTSLRYEGSLTTAPYTEGVQWFLMREKWVNPATVARFQSMFADGNARPTQPLSGRVVQVERPHR